MNQRRTLKEEYFSWLYNIIKQKRSYIKLCRELHKTIFKWSVPNDDNRCEDGLNLRHIFVEENKLDESHLEVKYFLKGDCTMFEMMVALAQRMDEITFDLKTHENRTSKWFWEMVRNLKLDKYTDNSSPYDDFDPVQEAEICDTLCDTLDRTYDRDGNGSLFPLKRHYSQDMRNTEIWYQLMLWLDENYGL